ncbi:MAG: alpha/beta fold hydrolase [candidate division Zixibacteria bacterium]|nr:alpha/beta fold hydrolase [candidate division Zixibacteria bacterium]
MTKNCFLLISLFSALCLCCGLGCTGEKVSYEEFSFYSIDSTKIEGQLYIPSLQDKIPPLVILLHMFSHSSKDWEKLVPLLTNEGYAVLNLDLRGHGKSVKRKEETISYLEPDKVNIRLLPLDVSSALDALQSYMGRVDLERVGVIGASIGANAGLIAAVGNPKIKTMVLISSGLNYHDLMTENAAGRLKDVSVLLIASRGDSYSLSSCQRLYSAMQLSKKEVKLVQGREHGNELLFKMPELNKQIANWIKENLPARRPDQIE